MRTTFANNLNATGLSNNTSSNPFNNIKGLHLNYHGNFSKTTPLTSRNNFKKAATAIVIYMNDGLIDRTRCS